MKRKSSRNFSRRARPLPENAPANTYRDSRPQPTIPQLREFLAFRRENKPAERDFMGAAMERAFGEPPSVGKKPRGLSRKQAFEAREAKRQAAA